MGWVGGGATICRGPCTVTYIHVNLKYQRRQADLRRKVPLLAPNTSPPVKNSFLAILMLKST